MIEDSGSAWAPTPAHLRAVAAAVVLGAVAVVAQRVDVVVLAAPFAAAATYGALRQPRRGPAASLRLEAETLGEGRATDVCTAVDGGDRGVMVTVALDVDRWLELDPPGGAKAVAVDGPTEVSMLVRPRRWGRHEVRARAVMLTSSLGAFRSVITPPPVMITALPLADVFAASDALTRPAGLVGLHRSRRQGDGSELAEVRPFRPGDRLRRINWPVSSRTGSLHVTAALTDRDTEVVLVLDSELDLGVSDGVDGRASSLDVAVRAAGAIAEHHLLAGDRVSLTDLGARVRTVPAAAGRAHLRRLLEVLVSATPGIVRGDSGRPVRRVRSGSLVIVLSPLLGGRGVGQVAQLALQCHAVIVVDTLPDHAVDATTPWRALAWRLRLLERQAEIDRLAELGVPTVRWHGRSTLDEVLRGVHRMATSPRVRR